MPKPKSTTNSSIPAGFKVRIVIHGAIIHAITSSEPIIQTSNGEISSVHLDLIHGTEHGDSIGFIKWSEVSAITWRSTMSQKTQTSV